jgi:hypothetical protein
MQQNIILCLIVLALILIVFYYSYQRKIESFINVDKERFEINVDKNLCANFDTDCVGKNNQSCENVNIIACQKFKIKCQNKCKHKNIDDNDKKVSNIDDCYKTCEKVKTDCCSRLDKLI